MRSDVTPHPLQDEAWDGAPLPANDNRDLRHVALFTASLCLALLVGFVAGITA